MFSFHPHQLNDAQPVQSRRPETMEDFLSSMIEMDVITGTRAADGTSFVAMVTDCPIHGLDVHDEVTASQN